VGRRFSFTVAGDRRRRRRAWWASATARPRKFRPPSQGVEEAKKNFFRVPRIGGVFPENLHGAGQWPPTSSARFNDGISISNPPAGKPRHHSGHAGHRPDNAEADADEAAADDQENQARDAPQNDREGSNALGRRAFQSPRCRHWSS